jgi:hypothetical protein
MRLRKTIKRIVALGTGATMVGATLLGAMAAADLSDYPAPFVADGAFNALLVVGAAAKTEDVLGAIDIATSLQYSTTVTKPLPGSGTTISVSGEGVKIETDSNQVTIGEALRTVKTRLDDEELPALLKKGTYVNDGDDESTEYEYSQELEFGPTDNATVTWVKDDDLDEEDPHLVLLSPKASGSDTDWFLKYTLDFSKDANSDWYTGTTCGSANELCDFEETQVEILGVEYDVTKAEWDGTTITWEMMGGVSLNTMYEGETKTFTVNGVDYEVTVDIISDTGSSSESVILTINGESTKELFKDQTQSVAGIEVGIKQVMGNEAGEANAGKDLVQFYLGAQKVVFTDAATGSSNTWDSNVKVGGTDVDELYVDFYTSGGSGNGVDLKIQKIELTWRPEDNLFVAEGTPVTFPGLGSFEVLYEGLTSSGEEEVVVIEQNGEDVMQITAPLQAGSTTFDFLYRGATTNYTEFGSDDKDLHVTGTPTLQDGDWMILSDSTERETHVVELDNVDSRNVTRLKDLADGSKYEATCTSTCTINVGDVQAVFSSVDNDAGTATVGSGSDISNLVYTKEGLTINLGTEPTNAASHTVTIREEDENSVLNGGNQFQVTCGTAGSDYKVSVTTITDVDAFETAVIESNAYQEYGTSDDLGYYSQFGTRVVHDTGGDQDKVTIYYPGEEAHANVFVNSETAVVSEGGGSGTYEEVQRIEVGAAVLDSEVGSLTAQNTIVVGGPCVNSLAAELMGNPAQCAEGFEMGKAMIKLFEHDNGNVAMLVAGYSAMDSRRAARVVANYEQYDNFAGTELEVTGTSLTDISVGVPVAEEEMMEEEAAEE